jgi:hypothetical protein
VTPPPPPAALAPDYWQRRGASMGGQVPVRVQLQGLERRGEGRCCARLHVAWPLQACQPMPPPSPVCR